jgi:hypothetical protein
MTLSIIEVDDHRFAGTAKIEEFKITCTLPDGAEGVFYPPLEPIYPLKKTLSSAQMQGLWLITEGTVLTHQLIPSWRIAELLKKPPSNVSSRVTTPLEKMKLIRYENRPTSRKSSHPRKEEKIWSLVPGSMQTTYDILVNYFMEHNFSNLVLGGFTPTSKSHAENRMAAIRCTILIYLKKRIDQYEDSLEWYHDNGITPPPGISSKKEHEALLNPNHRTTPPILAELTIKKKDK